MLHGLNRVFWLGGLLVALGGCSSVSEMISPAEVDPPAELVDLTPSVVAKTRWERDTGVGSKDQHLNLAPVYRDGRIYVADAEGEVSVLDAENGRTLWSVNLDVPASGGPGLGEGLVLIGTRDAEVVALSATDGSERWRVRVSSEVLAAPVASRGRVIVRTIDGKVAGLDVDNGERKWLYEREIPVLTLRGTSAPVVSGDMVLCGMSGGKLIALDVQSGDLVWEATISVPSGRSELERLSDIDGDPLLADGIVYVATYQGEVAALGERSGSLLWRRKFSSYSGMAANRYNVFASDSDGLVWALDADNGNARWKQEGLKNRRLSSVAVIGDVLAVGDFEGYVHFLSTEDGSLIGRTRVGDGPITRGMLVVDDTLYVQGSGGEFEAMSVVDQR